jgi:hypothetical protein
VTALHRRFTQALTRIERSIPGQNGNFHPAPLNDLVKAGVSYTGLKSLARGPSLFMQIFEDKGATFFNDGTANVIAPGVTARIAAAGQIVLGELLVIL